MPTRVNRTQEHVQQEAVDQFGFTPFMTVGQSCTPQDTKLPGCVPQDTAPLAGDGICTDLFGAKPFSNSGVAPVDAFGSQPFVLTTNQEYPPPQTTTFESSGSVEVDIFGSQPFHSSQ